MPTLAFSLAYPFGSFSLCYIWLTYIKYILKSRNKLPQQKLFYQRDCWDSKRYFDVWEISLTKCTLPTEAVGKVLNWPKKLKHQGLLLRYLLNNKIFENPNSKLACQVFGLLGMLYQGSLTFCMRHNNWIRGFFCPICRWTGDHPPEDLAKLRLNTLLISIISISIILSCWIWYWM